MSVCLQSLRIVPYGRNSMRIVKLYSVRLGWLYYRSKHRWRSSGVITTFGFNKVRPRQNCCRFADELLKWIILNENIKNSLKVALKFVPKVPINNIPALVKIMAWCRPGDKLLSEPIRVNLQTQLCINRPQWVYQAVAICNTYFLSDNSLLVACSNHFCKGVLCFIKTIMCKQY